MYEERIQESLLLAQHSDVCHVVQSGKSSNSVVSVKRSTFLPGQHLHHRPNGGVLSTRSFVFSLMYFWSMQYKPKHQFYLGFQLKNIV